MLNQLSLNANKISLKANKFSLSNNKFSLSNNKFSLSIFALNLSVNMVEKEFNLSAYMFQMELKSLVRGPNKVKALTSVEQVSMATRLKETKEPEFWLQH